MDINTELFVEQMKGKWLEIGNQPNTGLLEVWKLICDTLNFHRSNRLKGRFTALAIPTGCGKTLAAVLYCALLQTGTHPGVLFVTRHKAEATKLANQINDFSGSSVALAYHTDAPLSLEQIRETPVLLITHKMYDNIRSELIAGGGENQLHVAILGYIHGDRSLTIIDEAPTLFQEYRIGLSNVGLLHGLLRTLVISDIAPVIHTLDKLIDNLSMSQRLHMGKDFSLDDTQIALLAKIDLEMLTRAVNEIDPSSLKLSQLENYDAHQLKRICAETIHQLGHIKRLKAGWMSSQGVYKFLNGAEALCTEHDVGGVIFDATANIDAGYKLLVDKIEVCKPSFKMRSYGNVELNISTGHKVGKNALMSSMKRVWPVVADELLRSVPSEYRVLICCHKVSQEQILGFENGFQTLSKAHYGELTGVNTWQDYEAIALVGLPYLDDISPANLYMAFKGTQSTEWLQNAALRAFDQYEDIREFIAQSHTIKTVVQTINRIRCRKPIDASGNCAPTMVFIMVPDTASGRELINAIRVEMPGIQSKKWSVPAALKTAKPSPQYDAIDRALQLLPSGSHTKAEVQELAETSSASLDRYISTLRNPHSTSSRLMHRLHITYQQKRGRNGYAVFNKAAA